MAGNEQEALTSDSENQADKNLTRGDRIKQAIYNKDKNEFLGRTWQSWLALTTYYVCVNGVFVALFAILLWGDNKMRNKTEPEHNIYKFQPILQEPGVVVIPRGDGARFPEIKILESDKNIAEINTFLAGYPQSATIKGDCRKDGNVKNCTVGRDNQTLGECSPDVPGQNYGYISENESPYEPCIILKVNKIFGWVPKPKDAEHPASMLVTCTSLPDIQGVEYKGTFRSSIVFPTTGFSFDCFPYCGKDPKDPPYAQPFVMVKFKGIDSGQKTAVICQLEAGNIKDSQKVDGKLVDQIGSISFVLNLKDR